MARISSYVDASPVVAADKWIGSDSVNKQQTKNFTAQKVADFINKTGGQAQNLRYTYNNTTAYTTGSIAFANGGAANIPLNSITTFNVGAFDLRSPTKNLGDFITNALVSSEILLSDCSDIDNWAIYSWNTAVITGVNGEYQIGLTFKAGGGSLIEDRDYFISLLNNDASISNFTFDLDGNSLSYTITHGMNKFPSVSVIEDGTNNQVFGNVTYNNLNQCTISFSSLVTGKATFN
jgi:hypothetical protein|tara:strand:- start:624 stop:1328 length:705 start_codon:yes stop_codon:yes gene_type:complete